VISAQTIKLKVSNLRFLTCHMSDVRFITVIFAPAEVSIEPKVMLRNPLAMARSPLRSDEQ
jgi:hypothetical protein